MFMLIRNIYTVPSPLCVQGMKSNTNYEQTFNFADIISLLMPILCRDTIRERERVSGRERKSEGGREKGREREGKSQMQEFLSVLSLYIF